MKKLVYQNKMAIKAERERLESLIPAYNELAEAWNQLDIDQFSIKHLQDVKDRQFKDAGELAETLVTCKVSEQIEPEKRGKFSVRKEKLTESLELPDHAPLVPIIQRTTKVNQGYPSFQLVLFSDNFATTEKGVIIDEKHFKKEVVDKYSTYATTEKEKKVFESLDKLRDAIKEVEGHLHESYLVPLKGFDNETELREIFFPENGKLGIEPTFFKQVTG